MSGWHSLSGLLYSKPTGAFSRFKSKKQQYYVFEESRCELLFYKDKRAAALAQPQGAIRMRGASITLHPEEPNCFIVHSESKEFVLQAENHESMMIWLLALQANRDAFAGRQLQQEQRRGARQHARRESAPDFVGNRSEAAAALQAGGRRKGVTSTLDAAALMTRSAIQEEEEYHHGNGHQQAGRQLTKLFGSRMGLSLSQSFTSGLAPHDGEESDSSEAEFDSSVALAAGARPACASAPALQTRADDSGIDAREPARMLRSSVSDESPPERRNSGVRDLEQQLLRSRKEFAELTSREAALKEVLRNRDSQIAELDLRLSKFEQLAGAETPQLALPKMTTESSARDWMAADMKHLEEQCRILQNKNRFLNNEVKKITGLWQQERGRLTSVERTFRDQRLEIENWKRDYLFLLQSCITIPTGDVNDGFELNVYGGHRHRERLRELLEDARVVNPRLPTFESLAASEFHVDSFGFKHSHDNESLLLHYICRQLHEHYTSLLDRWEEHQRQWKNFVTANRGFTKTNELKQLVRNGIPRMYRSAVWRELVRQHVEDIRALKGQHYYTTLTQQIHDSEAAGYHRKQISLDLLRTMPTNLRFDANEAEGIQKLQEILQALCIHNPTVGYCQGMNFLAGMGLLFLSKEDTFWLLVAITEEYFHPLYFTSNLIGAQADQLVLKDILKQHLPELHDHLQELEIDLATVTLNWFLAVFFDAVPFQTLLRIWDCFLLEGPKVLFRFTLGILKMHEKVLRQQTDTISVWRHLKAAAKLTFDVEGLVKAAFDDLRGLPRRKEISDKQNSFIRSLKEQETLRRKRREAFQECEDKLPEFKTRSIDQPLIECGGCFRDSSVWICYGDQSRTRICRLRTEENLMYNLMEEIDSHVMCTCAMEPSILLLGTLSMYIVAFDTQAEERLWQCRIQDSVLDLCCSAATASDSRVFAALANGAVAVLDHVGFEEPNNNIFYVTLSSSPLTSLLLVNTDLWVACGNFVQLLDAECLDPKQKFHVSNNPFDSILCLRRSHFGVWIGVRGSSVIELWDEDTLTCCLLYDVKELKYPIFRKDDDTLFNPFRITSLLPMDDSLWVGTGSGDLVVFAVNADERRQSRQPPAAAGNVTSAGANGDSEESTPRASRGNSPVGCRSGPANATTPAAHVGARNESDESESSDDSEEREDSDETDENESVLESSKGTSSESTSACASSAVLQPFDNILGSHRACSLLLTVRNKVSESPIKCLILARAGSRGDSCIVSCCSRLAEDESVLKWRREGEDRHIWTNEPIFLVNPVTNTISLPAYMSVRDRLASSDA